MARLAPILLVSHAIHSCSKPDETAACNSAELTLNSMQSAMTCALRGFTGTAAAAPLAATAAEAAAGAVGNTCLVVDLLLKLFFLARAVVAIARIGALPFYGHGVFGAPGASLRSHRYRVKGDRRYEQ